MNSSFFFGVVNAVAFFVLPCVSGTMAYFSGAASIAFMLVGFVRWWRKPYVVRHVVKEISMSIQPSSYAWSYAPNATIPGMSFTFSIGEQEPTPFAPQPVDESTEVIRAWRWYYTGIDGLLHGARQAWPARTFHAECGHGNNIDECIASKNRECGIYSFRSPASAGYHAIAPPLMEVFADVVNYGVVHKYSDGYRSEWSRIDRIYLIAGTSELGKVTPNPSYGQMNWTLRAADVERCADALERRYGVPVEVVLRDEIQQWIDEEEKGAWERLASRSKSSGFRSLDELSPTLQSELNQLLPESL